MLDILSKFQEVPGRAHSGGTQGMETTSMVCALQKQSRRHDSSHHIRLWYQIIHLNMIRI